MNWTQKRIAGLVAAGILGTGGLQAYDWKQAQQALSAKQQAIVQAAAFTAVGDLEGLQEAFVLGLNSGLSINALKEIVLQLYAYTGFPRCLNAAGVLEQVVQARREAGQEDLQGPQPAVIPAGTDRYELGKKNLEVLVAAPLPSHPAAFIQDTDTFLKEHLFADIFARGVLSYSERELATVAALAALGNVAPQLQAHIGVALNVGVTEAQLEGLMAVIKSAVGRKTAVRGMQALEAVLKTRPQK